MLRSQITRSSLLAGLFCASIGASAQAALITGVTATASTTFAGEAPIKAVDGTGLNSGGTAHDRANDASYPNSWRSSAAELTGPDNDPWFLVDLGAVYNISSWHFWNFNEGGGGSSHGLTSALITYSTSNPAGTGSTLGTPSFNQAPGEPTYTGEVFNDSFTARYILFDIVNSFDNMQGNFSYGISEIQFTGELIPEPNTAILLVIGSAFLFLRRRRVAVR